MRKIIIALCLILLTACGSQNTNNTNANSGGSSGKGDEVSVEGIYIYDTGKNYYNFSVKIRNNTDHDYDWARIYYKVLDKNGDSLTNDYNGLEDVDAGQAGQLTFQVNNSKFSLDDIDKISFYKFELYDLDDKKFVVESTKIAGEFKEPIVYSLSEIEKK